MSDRRIDVVAEVLDDHGWDLDQHATIATEILAALDADARAEFRVWLDPQPVVPRPWSDRDRSSEVEQWLPEVTLEQAVAAVEATRHEGIGEFHKDTSHNPEA